MISKYILDTLDKIFNGPRPENIPDGVVYEYGVKYADDEQCVADWFRPKDKEIKGVIVNVRGGGFLSGAREGLREFCSKLASYGYFVFSIDYPLAPRKRHPHPITSTLEALKYLADNSEAYNINMDNVYLTGDSAGCYFVSYAIAVLVNKELMDKYFKEYNGLCDRVKVAGSMLYCGIYCMDTAMRTFPRFIFGDMVKEYLGLKRKTFWQYEDRDYLSPYKLVDKNYPPSLIVYAGGDRLKSQSVLLINKLRGLGVEVDEYYEKKGGHDFQLSLHKEHAMKCFEHTIEFLTGGQ